MIALQALSEYCSKTAGSELDLKVTVTASNKDVRKTFFVSNENALVRQEFEVINMHFVQYFHSFPINTYEARAGVPKPFAQGAMFDEVKMHGADDLV